MQLRFQSSDARTAFIAVLKQEDPYLYKHVKPLFSQPTVVIVEDIEGTAHIRLKSMLATPLGRSVKIYDDVQFENFGR